MAARAGGVLLSVHIAPVLEGRLVAFLVETPASPPGERWLPWTPLPQGANPYEIAATIVDEWCDGALSDLRLVDVISRDGDDGWELAIVFRAELTALPSGERAPPHLCAPQDFERVHGFAPVDLERWLGAGEAGCSPDAPAPDGSRLVF